jgi:hypothetical protein
MSWDSQIYVSKRMIALLSFILKDRNGILKAVHRKAFMHKTHPVLAYIKRKPPSFVAKIYSFTAV